MSYQRQRNSQYSRYPDYSCNTDYSRYAGHPRYTDYSRCKRPTRHIHNHTNHPFLKILALALVLLAIGIVCSQTIWKAHVEATAASLQISERKGALGQTTAPAPASYVTQSDLSEFPVPVSVSEIADTRYLQLINQEHSIESEPDRRLLESVWPSVLVIEDDALLHSEALRAIEDLFNAASEAGFGGFCVTSGYRDFAQQAQVYNETWDKATVQKPNHSEHQTGLAIDIGITGMLQSEMANSQEGQWLAENAWRFGLIVRYSEDKQDITHIAGEPWHFRYLGQPHAWYCWANNLCYEEYVQFLKDSGGYGVILDGGTFTVVYEWPENGLVYVPEDQDYCVSSDNTGGYIITACD